MDVKAGGGHTMSIGELCQQWMTKLEWYSTLFPRIPVPIQKMIEQKMKEWEGSRREAMFTAQQEQQAVTQHLTEAKYDEYVH